MSYLTQNRFPRLWDLFQRAVGGTHDKRRLCLSGFHGSGSILEVGCSTGNIAVAFRRYPHVAYTGIDIDEKAIAVAQRRFRNDARFRFVAGDLRQAFAASTTFDYVLFSGCLHHMVDDLAVELLRTARRHLSADGRLLVVDPLVPRTDDPWLLHQFIKIEHGEHVRSGHAMRALLKSLDILALTRNREVFVGATPLGRPICARFGVYELVGRS